MPPWFSEWFGSGKDAIGTVSSVIAAIGSVIAAVASYMTLRHSKSPDGLGFEIAKTCRPDKDGILPLQLRVANGHSYAWKVTRVEVLRPKGALLIRRINGSPQWDRLSSSRFLEISEAATKEKPAYISFGVLMPDAFVAPTHVKMKAVASSTFNERRRITKILHTTANVSAAIVTE